MKDFATIILKRMGSTALITVNRPNVYNALNRTVLRELEEALNLIEADEQIRVFIITGMGEKAFVSGADINELDGISAVEGTRWMLDGQRIFARIESSRKPSIAAVNGYCLGGGNELAMSCDLRLASMNAKFGQPEIKLGNIPGWGGTQRLPRMIGIAKAKELILTGEFLAASDAYDWGLVNKVLENQEKLMEEALRLADVMASRGTVALEFAKMAVNHSSDIPLDAGLALEACGVGLCISTVDQTEAVHAFLEKRPAVLHGR